MTNLFTYEIIDDSGVDYNFVRGFRPDEPSWLGQVVQGGPIQESGDITVEQPFGGGTYTAPASRFKRVED